MGCASVREIWRNGTVLSTHDFVVARLTVLESTLPRQPSLKVESFFLVQLAGLGPPIFGSVNANTLGLHRALFNQTRRTVRPVVIELELPEVLHGKEEAALPRLERIDGYELAPESPHRTQAQRADAATLILSRS